jgi:hypothetical protein
MAFFAGVQALGLGEASTVNGQAHKVAACQCRLSQASPWSAEIPDQVSLTGLVSIIRPANSKAEMCKLDNLIQQRRTDLTDFLEYHPP